MLRLSIASLFVALATSALAQGGTTAVPSTPAQYPPPAPPSAGYAPPPAQAQAPVQPQLGQPQAQSVPSTPAPGAAPATTYPAPGAAQATTPPAAQPQTAVPTIPPSAAPGAPGTPGAASSQQVVVNPPAQQPPGAAPGAPAVAPTAPSPPPRAMSETSSPVVVERETARPALEIVAIDAAYGALAGAVVGVGIALLDQGNNWGRDLTLGAGAGILVGAVVGGIQAYNQSHRSYAMDGFGSPDRDRASAPAVRTVVSLAGRF